MPDRVISVPQATQIATRIKNKFDNVNGRLDEQEEIVNTLNEGGLDIKDDVIEAQITDWLDNHPEATTTVQDGAITESKFSASVRKTVDASKIRDLSIDSVAFMNFYKAGYTSLEGVCALDDHYIVVVRYLPNDERSFSVWDINSQSFVAESVFTDAQVGHCNTITYAEPYIYVTALSSGNKVVRLLVDSGTKDITYDSVVYTGSAYPHCVAYSDGHFYCLREANNTFTLTVTDDFQNFTTLGTSSFDNGAYLTAQGMAVYGDLVFITFSTSFRYTGTDVTSERLPLLTEAIYVTDKNLNVLKTSFNSRGKWGESEGCDVMAVSGQVYLLVGTNRNDANVSSVHALPIFNDTEQLEVFYGCKVIGGPYKSEGLITFYVDSTYDSPFAKGNKSNPFGSIPVALTVARQIDAPVIFNITGTFPNMGARYFKNPIYLNITDSTITAVEISHCNNVYIKCSDATFGQMKIESSTVMITSGPSMEKMDESVETAITIYRSFVTGGIKYIGAFNNGLAVFASVVNASVTTSEATKLVNIVTQSLAYVNGNLQ